METAVPDVTVSAILQTKQKDRGRNAFVIFI
jgi:hypothetical protein